MEFNKKKNQLIWATGSQPITLLGILYFLVSSYEHEVIVSVIIFSVMLGIVFMSSLISAIRLLVIIKNQGKDISTEIESHNIRFFSYLNTKIIITLGTIGLIMQSLLIALSLSSGRLYLVVFWSVGLGITLISSFFLYKQSKLHSNTFPASNENS